MKERVPHDQLSVPYMKPGRYKHYRGDLYEVLGTGLDTETLDPVVIYKPLYESPVTWWVRPLSIFNEEIEVDGVLVPRFRYLPD